MRGTWGSGWSHGLKLPYNQRERSLWSVKKDLIRNAKHLDAASVQEGIPGFIVCQLYRLSVPCAVEFYREASRRTVEIEHVRSDAMLPAKFPTPEPSISQHSPERPFGEG